MAEQPIQQRNQQLPQQSSSSTSNVTMSFFDTNDPIILDLDILWPVKKEAVVEGDLVLGGLMMVHEREDTITCGPIMPQGGIQALEAMLYTLDRINSADTSLLPNITLGAHILDDCDKDTYGLEIAVDFIKDEEYLIEYNPADKEDRIRIRRPPEIEDKAQLRDISDTISRTPKPTVMVDAGAIHALIYETATTGLPNSSGLEKKGRRYKEKLIL